MNGMPVTECAAPSPMLLANSTAVLSSAPSLNARAALPSNAATSPRHGQVAARRCYTAAHDASDGQVREAGSGAPRHVLQALQQRARAENLRQRVAAGLDGLGRILEEDRQRVPPRPDVAPGTEAA